jgi:hypothetical protein
MMTELVNAEKMEMKRQGQFLVPAIERRQCLVVGEYVSVCRNGERFWQKLSVTHELSLAHPSNESLGVEAGCTTRGVKPALRAAAAPESEAHWSFSS